MSISIAEYLGQRTDLEEPVIVPAVPRSTVACPFMNSHCEKVKKGQKPVCVVRNIGGIPWIVCAHRLCGTKKGIPLSDYQRERLLNISRTIFSEGIPADQILLKREVTLIADGAFDNDGIEPYVADYILVDNSGIKTNSPDKVVLEMQGGGETSGSTKKHIEEWENNQNRTNQQLAAFTPDANILVTNAWRRQQEQFIIKGNVSVQTSRGGGMVFCMGTMLFDLLLAKVQNAGLRNLQNYNWTLALIGFVEDTIAATVPGPIPLRIDSSRMLFTNYHAFVRALTDQGIPSPQSFKGTFEILGGGTIEID